MKTLSLTVAVLGFVAPWAVQAELSSSDYVQNGLVTQLDGIENVGRGVAHDSTATVWKDLVGSLDFTLQAGGSWGDKYLAYDGLAAQAAANPSAYLTVEAHVRNDSGRIVFSSSDATRWLIQNGTKNGVQFCATGASLWLPVSGYGIESTWSATYSGNAPNAVALDGSVVSGSSYTDNWGTKPSVAMIGNRSATETTYKSAGELYALRLYSRALTANELALNAAIDRVRFASSDPATETWPDGTRYHDGKIEYRVTAVASDGTRGSVSSSEQWGSIGSSISVTATPASGYDLAYWEDVSTAERLSYGHTLTISAATRSVRAVFKKVVYVSLYGTGSQDGSSWSDAAKLSPTLAAVTDDKVVWCEKGAYAVDSTTPLTMPVATIVRGGFDKGATTSEGRTGESVFHSGHTNLVLAATTGSYVFENIAVSNALYRGISKTGAASLLLYNCGILDNGRLTTTVLAKTVGIQGRGMYAIGATAQSYLVLSNCLIKGNVDMRDTANNDNRGYGIFASSFKQVRLTDCQFFNNGTLETSHGSAWGRDSSRGWALHLVDAPILAENCHFRANRGSTNNGSANDSGAVAIDGNGNGSRFTHCSWVGNSAEGSSQSAPGGIVVIGAVGGSLAYTCTFDHCTFAYNLANRGYCAGLLVVTGSAVIRNSIFHGNIVAADSGKATSFCLLNSTKSRASIDIDYSLLPGTAYDYYNKDGVSTLTIGEHMTYGSADFATSDSEVLALMTSSAKTPVAIPASDYSFYFTNFNDIATIDIHLRSIKGRWNGSSWVQDDVFSPAIDKGTGDYSLESMPNGGRANLGCYGNTTEASKSPADITPEIASCTVANGSFYTRPTLALSLKPQADEFSASVTVYMGSEAKEGTTGWDRSYTYPATLSQGDALNEYIRWFFESGSTVYWKVVVATSQRSDSVSGSLVIAGENPPGWGQGGGADIIHVKADAIGSGEGDSWVDAVGTIKAAMDLVTETRTNIWIAGTVPAQLAGASFERAVCVRGGFAGTENSITERPEGTRSLVDGELTSRNCLAFTHGTGRTHMERINYTRSSGEGVSKTGAGDLAFYSCRGYANAAKTTVVTAGRGGYLTGSASTSTLVISNCMFDANITDADIYSEQDGLGLYLYGFKRVEMTDVLFATNGLWRTYTSRNAHYGAALYAKNAPIIANNVRFIGNRGTSHGGASDGYIEHTGSIVWLGGSSGGSVFSNCLWLANQSPANGANHLSQRSGALVVSLSKASDKVTLERCTFAYNLVGGRSAGLCVDKGAATVRNSIFWGNICAQFATGIDLYCRTTSGTIDADYTLLGNEPDVPYVGVHSDASLSQIVRGEHMVYADALFVTETNAVVAAMVNSDSAKTPFTPGVPLLSPHGMVRYADSVTLSDWSAHLQGRGGFVDEKTGVWQKVGREQSPAVNAGDPAADASCEPDSQKFRRLNLGYYANTPWATKLFVPPGLVFIVR